MVANSILLAEPKKAPRKSQQHRQWIAAIIATLTLFSMGMFLGWTSPTIPKFKAPDAEVPLDDSQVSWVVSLLYLGSMSSPLPTGLLMDRFGRKAGLFLVSVEALAAWAILLTTKSAGGVYLARFLGGMVGGSGYTVVPIYLCEIAEPNVRGALNSIFTLMAYLGIMFQYGIGPHVSYFTLNLLSGLVPLGIIILTTILPESPYFYLMWKDKEQAVTSLAWLRCAESRADVEEEARMIEKAVNEDMKQKKGVGDLLATSGNRRALFMTETLAVLQRMSGISVVMAYAGQAAPDAWVISNDECAMLICVTWIVFGFWATVLVNHFGRRTLTVVSCLGCGLSTAAYGVWYYLDLYSSLDLSASTWFPFMSLILYSAFFPIGLGCVPNMIQGEVFPANIKGLASGCTSIVIALTSFITNKMYHPIEVNLGVYVNYWIFASSCIFGVGFGLFMLIETKGKTLQEIQIELTENKHVKSNLTDKA